MTNQKKANAARQERFANYVKQVIVVDADWQVSRIDRFNWEVRHRGVFWGYYGNPLSAFQALPVKMLSAVATGDLKQILEQQARFNQLVASCLKIELANLVKT